MNTDLAQKNIAILGAGRSGFGAAKLARKLGGVPVIFDEGTPDKLARILAEFDQEGLAYCLGLDLARAAVATTPFAFTVISPGLDAGWPLPALFTEAGVPMVGEIEFAWQTVRQIPVVAITGTNGKTTTTELMERMFSGCGHRTVACGNYGLALSEVALREEPYDILTVEISSFQLETITTFRPRVAVWLNFAPDHLDRYPDEKSYFDAKHRIFDYMTDEDVAVVRAGEPLGEVSARLVTFTTEPGVEADFMLYHDRILFRGERIARVSDLPLHERHNIENQMASLAVGWVMGLPFEDMLEALRGYEPARHRCELVKVVEGRPYINDSKATNLHALETCLRSQDAPVVLIAGGKEKGLDYSPFRSLIGQKVTALVAIGEIADKLTALFSDLVPCQQASSVPDAVALATRLAAPRQAIVFSPGTSSFDMFSSYAERGNVFRDAVLNLPTSNRN